MSNHLIIGTEQLKYFKNKHPNLDDIGLLMLILGEVLSANIEEINSNKKNLDNELLTYKREMLLAFAVLADQIKNGKSYVLCASIPAVLKKYGFIM